jgi:hypothetical protein
MNTGYTFYREGNTRGFVPLTAGATLEVLPLLHLKYETYLNSSWEELQTTAYYAGFALVAPFLILEAGYGYRFEYRLIEKVDELYVGCSLYM